MLQPATVVAPPQVEWAAGAVAVGAAVQGRSRAGMRRHAQAAMSLLLEGVGRRKERLLQAAMDLRG